MSSPKMPGPRLDPKPQPPLPPELEDCCGSGCNPCIFDLHERAMERWRDALRAWHERHPKARPDAGPSQG